MKLGSRAVRLRAVWLLVIPFFLFARPRPDLLVVGGIVAALGAGVRAWAAGCIRKEKELATDGPYAHTRNPLYVGSFLIGLGVTAAGGRVVFVALFLLFFFVVYRRTMRVEERVLEEEFGDAYRDYRERVPLFFPRLTPYRAPGREGGGRSWSFSPATYRRNREWEAGLGLVAALALLVAKMVWLG